MRKIRGLRSCPAVVAALHRGECGGEIPAAEVEGELTTRRPARRDPRWHYAAISALPAFAGAMVNLAAALFNGESQETSGGTHIHWRCRWISFPRIIGYAAAFDGAWLT